MCQAEDELANLQDEYDALTKRLGRTVDDLSDKIEDIKDQLWRIDHSDCFTSFNLGAETQKLMDLCDELVALKDAIPN